MEISHISSGFYNSFLPDELWLGVFLQLSALQDILSSTLVCKHWRRLLVDNVIWQEIYERKSGKEEQNSKFLIRTQYIRKTRITKNWKNNKSKLYTLVGHKDRALCAEIDPVMSRIVSGSQDKTGKTHVTLYINTISENMGSTD